MLIHVLFLFLNRMSESKLSIHAFLNAAASNATKHLLTVKQQLEV